MRIFFCYAVVLLAAAKLHSVVTVSLNMLKLAMDVKELQLLDRLLRSKKEEAREQALRHLRAYGLSSKVINTLRSENVGETFLHCAAKYGTLDMLPAELLTERNFRIADLCGNTPLHWAATNGNLAQVPRSALTEANLMEKNWYGTSVFVEASEYGSLDPFLGLELSEAVIPEVGSDWYEENLLYCKRVNEPKLSLSTQEEGDPYDISLF